MEKNFVELLMLRDHSKSTLARNFQFFTLLAPLFVSVRFTCIPRQRTFALVGYPPPLSKKFRDAYDAYFE